ncbi:uncharacterized protein Tes [Periplaneta americana]|uniref:uncharacterized protein Tes n=1 Tax=Periplaneta americana TaxID=6978 RepID=UPI0037E8FEB4
MSEETAKTPEWMLLLENKKKRPHRLAHEIGAGAPCLSCGDACPGLDLHFWRKSCRNCRCKKEEHDVRDDEGYEQFEILFASTGVGKKKRTGAFLNIKVPETSVSVSNTVGSSGNTSSNTTANKKGIAFDWIPPDVPEDVAAEYMQQLPPSKLPISGSDGALYRRQQLEKQVPLHDLDASKCHGLTPDEIQGLQQYLENLKNNVVGQGRVTKLPVLYAEQRLPYSGPARHQSVTVAHSAVTGESRPIRIASSHSAQCLRSLPSIPLPRPFTTQHYDKDDPNSFPPPPPLPDSLPTSTTNLKTPSAFLPSVQNNVIFQSSSADSQLVADHFPYDLVYSEQGVQPSAQLPGGKQANFLPSTLTKGHMSGGPTLTHARDGAFVSEQQAHDIAYSTQIPVGLVSQQTRALNTSKEGSQTDKENQLPPFHNANIPSKSNSSSRDGIVTASKHPSAVSFSTGLQSGTALIGNAPNVGRASVQDETSPAILKPIDGSYSSQLGDNLSHFPSLQSGNFLQGGIISSEKYPSDVAQSSVHPGHKHSLNTVPLNRSGDRIPRDDSFSQSTGSLSDKSVPHGNQDTILSHDATFVPYSSNISGQVVHSESIGGDSMPKSAFVMQQSHLPQQEGLEVANVDYSLAEKLGQLSGLGDSTQVEEYRVECHKCKEVLLGGQVAVLAERAGKQAAWHPQCFVCCTCEELLVDLIYFFHKGDVYCGRHYAELLDIPRCFACDELIFVKEYTCAEGKAFHVKHFCCYECDTPLGGKHYIPKDNQPVCLECYETKYGKSCHTCKLKIAAGDQRVGWKDLSWHVSPNCFRCAQCTKSLLGGKFVVKNEKPFCSKECVQLGA